jgi:hypothetical protein
MSKWSRDGITTTIRAKGRVEFSDDDTDLKSLEPGGSFEITESAGWFSWTDRRKFQAHAKSDGSIARRYFVDGNELSVEEGRKWLRGFLPTLLRESAIGADRRVARWLKQSGPDGVLREITQVQSHWAKHVYFAQLFDQAPLDSATLARALQQAGREVSSDFEQGNVLKKAAARFTLDETSAAAYSESSRHIGSDFEQRHALAAALKQPALPPAAAAVLLNAAVPQGDAGIDSDFELVELLVQLPAGVPDKTGAAYVNALNTVDSDFEHRRALRAVVARRGTPKETLDAALKSAQRIGSDFELATLLIELVEAQGVPEPRHSLFDALRTIDSDFERKRVLSTLAQQPGLTDADITALGKLTGEMGSDFERAEVLLAIVGHQRLSTAGRDALLGAAQRIGSDHERGRVLSAMLNSGVLSSSAGVK